MPRDWPKLAKPPIVEAIIDIDCDLPSSYDIAKLPEAAKVQLKASYPEEKPQYLYTHIIEAASGNFASRTNQQSLAALQFWSSDGKQVIQLRGNGFSFNRLADYTNLDDYLPEIFRAWEIFTKVAEPQLIRVIRLRYVNRILIPLENGRVELDDYLQAGPRLPDEKGLELVGFLTQHTAVDRETGFQVDLVLTRQPPSEPNILPIIFDNSVSSLTPREVDDLDGLTSTIEKLRQLKDRMFFMMMTERCQKLFQ